MDTEKADLYEKALTFAVQAHQGQRRKFSCEPYVMHCIRVSQRFPVGSVESVVALLHDVIEDCDVAGAWLAIEFGGEVASGVEHLTRIPGMEYMEYIGSVGPWWRVKRADIEDNLRDLPAGHSLRDRYHKALELLAINGVGR